MTKYLSALDWCDQCAALSIQGIPCHETGCPNQSKIRDEDGQWVKPAPKCFECGCECEGPDDRGDYYCNCQDPIESEGE